MLQIHEPIAFPSAIPESPTLLAMADTTNSGVVVARLTNVPPMTNRGIRSACPMSTLESTNRSPALGDQTEPDDDEDDVVQHSGALLAGRSR